MLSYFYKLNVKKTKAVAEKRQKKEIQGVLTHRGFLGEEEIRVEPNPCKMRNVLVLNHSNGGNSFSKSTF